MPFDIVVDPFGVLKPMVAEKAKQRQIRKPVSPKSAELFDTRKEIAKEANISHDTLDKVEKVEKQGIDELKDTIAVCF